MISLKDIGWIAGFLEGEGCFAKSGNSFVVTASQKEIEPLKKLQRFVGGTIHLQNRQYPIYRWRLYGKMAAGLCMTIFTFMSIRRQISIRQVLRLWLSKPLAERDRIHCPHGHPYNKKNTWIEVRPNGSQRRRCRECNRLRYYKKAA